MKPSRRTFVTLACLFLAAPAIAQQDSLKTLRAMQNARTKLIREIAPAVCSVGSLKSPGGGSGVIISPRGWALTNYHVTRTAKVMKIGLPNGNFYLADVIGVDPGGDISLMALRGKGPLEHGEWPSVKLGDSDKLRIGGFAYALGNPFLLASDLTPTVTMGIISGIHRYQKGSGPNGRMLLYPDCIQVDTPINPGNSGGPLFDENGLLVGINGRIQIRGRGRVNTGVGFAVSINQIKNFLPDLLAGRHCEHGTLDMNAWKMRDPNTGKGRAIFVQATFPDSVVAKAGLMTGDKLLAFNGNQLRFANELARDVGSLPAGFEVELTYQKWLDGSRTYAEPKTVRLRLAALDTGSSREGGDFPNVPDFSERPDFDELRADYAKRPKPPTIKSYADLAKHLPEDLKKKLPDGWKKKLPRNWREQLRRKVERYYREKKAEVPLEVDVLIAKKRDLDREEGLFRYMDGVVEDFVDGFEQTLSGFEKGGDRSFEVEVTRYSNGRAEAPKMRKYAITGSNLTVTEGKRVRSIADADDDADTRISLERESQLDLLLRPWSLRKLAIGHSFVEGGIHTGTNVGEVLKLRGPGRRAVFLDSRGHYPVGYRYHSYIERGKTEVLFSEFKTESGRKLPSKAKVFVNKELRETWTFKSFTGIPGFESTERGDLPTPDPAIENHLKPLFASVVKIYGASGFAGLENYASGLVVSDKGHILAWDHAMLTNLRGQVVLADGSEHDARVVARSEELGVVLLKIDPEGIPEDVLRPLELPTEPETYEPGTPVLSIGNSYRIAEFEEWLSVTLGVVVSTVRSDLRLKLQKFPFQGDVLIVDAPSNPGTQGGGLFTVDGKLIGMLTPLIESRETNTQLSVVIPAFELSAFVAQFSGKRQLAKDIVAVQKSRKKVYKPVYTGIKLFDSGRRRSPPAYVDRVIPGSPAAKSKLRPDDLIVRINEFPVQNCVEYRRILREFGPGDRIDVTFKRGTRVDKVSIVLEEVKK